MPRDDTPRRVLVVEDEVAIRELLRLHLQLAGFTLDEVGDGRVALDRARATRFDLILLDVMLPGLDGVTLCGAIRAGGPNAATPILMLTARDAESDKVTGLESGADDYLTKPFGIRELMARVKAITRRHERADQGPSRATQPVRQRDVSLDHERRTALVRGEPVELTKQEFDLLYLLAARPGIVFSRAALLQNVWSGDTYVTERTVDTMISRLRRKIERDPQDPELIFARCSRSSPSTGRKSRHSTGWSVPRRWPPFSARCSGLNARAGRTSSESLRWSLPISCAPTAAAAAW
jgi:DNA-binding response OmpR family regulator